MLGLPQGTVQLHPHNAEWSRLFREEKARIQHAIGDYILDIQHIGSTAVPGIAAKPILDIGIAVTNFEEAARCILPLERIGYTYRGELGIPRRHYFVKGEPRTHHVHMNEIHSADWINHLRFRDYLLQHLEIAGEYEALKRRLAREFPTDREAYTNGKSDFIQSVLQRAREKDRRR